MNYIKRLMEIKEEQLRCERIRIKYAIYADAHLEDILKVLKGGVKNGNKNKKY